MIRYAISTPLCAPSFLISSLKYSGIWTPKQHYSLLLKAKYDIVEEVASSNPKVPRVVLKKGKTQIFRDGDPMVYSGAVDRIIGRPPPQSGDAVFVTDGASHPIAWGIYNSSSMFCVRIMQMEDEISRDSTCALNIENLLELRILAAVDLRRRLGLPSNHTDVYRLVNSEGDRLSGLVVDIFGRCVVVASSALWVEKYKEKIRHIIEQAIGPERIIWRPSVELLKEEGLEIGEQQTGQTESTSNDDKEVKVIENGIYYMVSFEGQKTGFYADQRENRLLLRSLANGKTVLDLCCYSGGFALNAAVGKAARVLGVDSSLPAMELTYKNISLNNMDTKSITFLKADVSDFMKEAIKEGNQWDIVVLDPPKLAPSRKFLRRASGMYRHLNSLAMQLVTPGGLLMTCSCSGAMTQSGSFPSVLQGSAVSAGRKITQIRCSGAAMDHTIDPSYPEGMYLTNTLLRVL